MRTLPVGYAPEAAADLNAIQDWLIERGAATPVALGYVFRIEARCGRLALTPSAGRPRPELGARVRSVAFERTATVFYAVEPERVLILRILRRGRDVEAQFTP